MAKNTIFDQKQGLSTVTGFIGQLKQVLKTPSQKVLTVFGFEQLSASFNGSGMYSLLLGSQCSITLSVQQKPCLLEGRMGTGE